MSWTPQKQVQQMVRSSTSRRLLINVCILTLAIAILSGTAATYQVRAAQAAPPTISNFLVDQDHNLPFSQNKQNEPAITRDPLTGVLIAGANDEIEQPLCPGTTTPLASPCPFAPGVPTSAFYRSTDGKTWTGGFLPGFDTIGRVSGGDPSLDYGPRLCPMARSASPAASLSITPAWLILSLSLAASRSQFHAPMMTLCTGPIQWRLPPPITNPISTITSG